MKIKYSVLAFAVLAAIAFATVGILQKPDAGPETSKALQQTAAVPSQKGEKAPSIPKKKGFGSLFFLYRQHAYSC